MLDCLIIGGGPAGLTAAIYLARYRRAACVIDAGDSRAALIPETHNYPGFAGIGGPELLRRLRDQACMHGAHLEQGIVHSIRRRQEDGAFIARAGNKEIIARTVVIATGLVDECPTIDGLAPRQYVGPIRFCPICDGFEAIDKRVGVLGDWKSASRKALFMRTYTRDVTLFPIDERSTRANPELQGKGIAVAGRPARIEVQGGTVAVTVEGGLQHRLDVLYPALGAQVNSGLAVALHATCDETGMVRVDEHQQTSVDGLYAAGDVVTDLHQINVATAHAAIAATHIHNRLPCNPR